MRAVLERLDRFQQRHAWLAFPVAVAKKFGDDRAGYLAALIAYYGFFSLFPLLLVLITVLSIVLQGDPDLRARILDTAVAQFPVIGDQIRQNVGEIRGSGLALAVGIATALWAGLAVTAAVQNAMNEVWGVPRERRPSFVVRLARGLLLLAVLGTMTIAATLVSSLAASVGDLSFLSRAVGLLGGLALQLALFLVVFKGMTRADVSVRDVLPGAAIAAVGWTVLLAIGGWLVASRLREASQIYGVFAFVIALLVWLYLGAQLTLYAAEVNVVRARRLWPRSLFGRPSLVNGNERGRSPARP